VSNDRVFGTWTAVNLSLASNSDGHRYAASVVRPFHSLGRALGRGRRRGDGQPHRRGLQRRQRRSANTGIGRTRPRSSPAGRAVASTVGCSATRSARACSTTSTRTSRGASRRPR
jgi:hypothetical protein